MKVLFSPDWRSGNEYQQRLSLALKACDVDVGFASMRPQTLLGRSFSDRPGIWHVHWPESALSPRFPRLLARMGLAADDLLMRRVLGVRLVVTAHNLFPHEIRDEGARAWYSRFYASADAVIAHAAAAADAVVAAHGVQRERITVIPHGDLAAGWDLSGARAGARQRLGVGDERICLMFGTVRRYKGILSVARFWREAKPPARLVIVGSAGPAYGAEVAEASRDVPSIDFRRRFLPDAELKDWLAAADCAVFNYDDVLTSGAAMLARSCGVPVLLPRRLTTVDLGEPDARVVRFDALDESFLAALERALSVAPDFASAAPWRAATAWDVVAAKTAAVYRDAIARR